jgi:hypothetical protein
MGGRSSGWFAGAVEYAEGRAASDPRWPVVIRWAEWIGTATIFMSIGIVLAGLANRAPPFRLVEAAAPAAMPGETVTFEARVWRDTARQCSVNVYRSVFHSNGKRVDLDPQFFEAADIAAMERKTPGMMMPQVQIPADAVPGADSYLSTRLRYICNVYQTLLPIDVQFVQPFSVITR